MNIFVLDKNIKKAAAYHCDKHVVKMCLEYAQILCTNAWFVGEPSGYKKTHLNHPCTAWARESVDNTIWLASLLNALGDEYTSRYNKVHHSVHIGLAAACRSLRHLPVVGLTPFAQAMPERYQDDDAVAAYRRYYIQEKAGFATWKNGEPYWWRS